MTRMDVLNFILTTVALGVLASLPTIIIGQLLVTKGMMREKPVQVLVLGIATMLFAQLMASEWCIGGKLFLVAISVPLGISRWERRHPTGGKRSE
jgi:hypothetical protein